MKEKEKLIVKNLGPLKEAIIEPRPLTIIVGEQATGKSLVAQLLYFFRGLEELFARIFNPELCSGKNWPEQVVRKILDDLRGVSFAYFANGTADIQYSFILRNKQKVWNIKIYSQNRVIRPLKKGHLLKQLNEWAKLWQENKQTLGKARILKQVFIPTERSMFTRLINTEPSALYAPYQPLIFRNFADILTTAANKYQDLCSIEASKTKYKQENKINNEFVKFIIEKQEEILKGKAYVPSRGPKEWKWDIDRKKILPIQATASGQMEAWPFFVIAATFGASESQIDFYFEEPETHLHPRAQVKIMEVIAFLVNHGHTFTITTHSPYILYIVNNLIQRFISYKGRVPEGQVALNPKDICAYKFTDKAEEIVDEETELIDTNELERIADELGGEFDRLLEMEYE
jgi:hypothetical protein